MDNIFIFLFMLFVLQAIASAILAMVVASEKGYSSITWFIFGLVFGVLGLIAAAGLPTKRN